MGTLNDQVGYVSVARILADTGSHRSAIYLPSLESQATTKNYLYMPGHYVALAVSYGLFGFGHLQSILPSMVSYILAALAVFATGTRLYGPRVGSLGAVLFLIFPANPLYALTAMAEMTLIASAMTAFSTFVFLPPRWRVYVGPCLVCLPLVFRETGAAIAVPMALLIVLGSGRPAWRDGVVFCSLTALVTLGTLNASFSAGRPSLLLANILSEDFNTIYGDAVAIQSLKPGPIGLLLALGEKFVGNFSTLVIGLGLRVWHLFANAPMALETVSMVAVLSALPLGRSWGLPRRDALVIGTAVLVATLLGSLLLLYTVWSFRGLRILLLATPFVCINWALVLTSWASTPEARGRSRLRRSWLVTSSIAGMGLLGFLLLHLSFVDEPRNREQARLDVSFLESLEHDNTTMLVAPWQIAMEYVYRHHPVQWAFLPANRETLRLLNDKYRVGTLILPRDRTNQPSDLSPEDVLAVGFELVLRTRHSGVEYLVFQPFPSRTGGPTEPDTGTSHRAHS